MIQITAKQEGFRRCGQTHGCAMTEYSDDHWTKEQLAMLQVEPMLIVTVMKEEKNNQLRPNAKDAIALVKAAANIDELTELAKDEERQSVLAVIDARRSDLIKLGTELNSGPQENKEGN